MNRKVTILFLLIIIFLMILFLRFTSSFKIELNKLVVSEDVWNEIINTRVLSEENLLNKIKFNGYELLKTDDNKYYYSIIEGTNEYNPIVEYPHNVRMMFSNSITDENIEKNESLKVLIYNDSNYYITDIVCTTLPLLSIKYDDQYKAVTAEELTDMKMTLFDNRKAILNRTITSDGGIRLRGATSLGYPKTPFRVSLYADSIGNNRRDNAISILGMNESDDWVLYAGYNDKEKIRNVFSSNLWHESSAYNNEFDVENGTEYRYIELFINNKYWGLYAIGGAMEEKKLELNNEYMFKKVSWSNSEFTPYATDTMDGYRLINNIENDIEAWDILKKYYMELIYNKNINGIYEMTDMNTAVDIYLFYMLSQAKDNISSSNEALLKNTFITFKKKDGKYIALYAPWDLDITFGATWIGEANVNNTIFYNSSNHTNYTMTLSPIYILQTLNDKTINKMIIQRYNYLRKTSWSDENVINLIATYEDNIYNSGAILRDKERWPKGNYTSSNNLGRFKLYVLERLESMDEYISGLN